MAAISAAAGSGCSGGVEHTGPLVPILEAEAIQDERSRSEGANLQEGLEIRSHFYDGRTTWLLQPAAWQLRNYIGNGASGDVDRDDTLTGHGALRIHASQPANAAFQQILPVRSNAWYAFIGAVRVEDVSASPTTVSGTLFALEHASPRRAKLERLPLVSHHGKTRHGTTAWELEVLTFRTGPETKGVTLGLALGISEGGATGTAWFDGLALVEQEAATFAPGDEWPDRFAGLALEAYVRYLGGVELHDLAYLLRDGSASPGSRVTEIISQIDLDQRAALLSPAPGRLSSSRVRILPGSTLRFGYGVDPLAWGRPGDGVWFRVLARSDDNDDRELFGAYLDPKNDYEDRAWQEAVVPLDELAGETVVLVFETRGSFPVESDAAEPDSRFDYALWTSPRITIEAPPDRPHVLVVAVDTLRPDYLTPYGAEAEVSPTIDYLARTGVKFGHARATATYTMPSFASFFTSRSPLVHGANEGGSLRTGLPTLAGELRRAGYRTVAFHGGGYLAPEFGLGRGFDQYRLSRYKVGESIKLASEALRSAGDVPTFVFLHTYHVHAPYRENVEAIERFWPDYRDWRDEFFTPEQVRDIGDEENLLEASRAGVPEIPVVLRMIKTLYRGLIRDVDDRIGELLDELDAAGVLSNTLVVLMSDHGESFQEHGLFLHGNSLSEEQLRVPLIMRWPGHLPEGRVVDEPVSLMDVMPTLLELVGAPVPDEVEGSSLAALVAGDTSAVPADRALLAAHLSGSQTKLAVLQDGMKLVEDADLRQRLLFDLRFDPGQTRNLAATRPEMTRRLMEVLGRRLAGAPGRHLVYGGGADLASVQGTIFAASGPLGVRGLFLEPEDVFRVDGHPVRVMLTGSPDDLDWLWVDADTPPEYSFTAAGETLPVSELQVDAITGNGSRPGFGPWASSGLFMWEGAKLGQAPSGLVTPETLERLRRLGYLR